MECERAEWHKSSIECVKHQINKHNYMLNLHFNAKQSMIAGFPNKLVDFQERDGYGEVRSRVLDYIRLLLLLR